ncbi:MAG: SMC-Scp complex subunit ScpB [Candidatus Kerfeldbacteria bacterium]|nr:SMC-Scp complex subunit ScpB [Candidatus Kerfeldbacteria bacterium]
MSVRRNVESLLFAAAKPLSIKKLAGLADAPVEAVQQVLAELKSEYNRDEKGIQIQQHGQQVQMVTSPLAAKTVAAFLKDEQSGELTDPAIETLTIIAYRGPITKAELDHIRGVNCALILRHLMIKGLVEAEEDKEALVTRYHITFDFLRFLGLRSTEELPDYEQLRNDENLQELLAQVEERVPVDEARAQEVPTAEEGQRHE